MVRRRNSVSSVNSQKTLEPNQQNPQGVTKSSTQWKLLELLKTSQKSSQTTSKQGGRKGSDSSARTKSSGKETSISSCNCCGTVLTYLGTAQKFKCSICNTTNILVPDPPQEGPCSYPHLLSYRYIRKLVDQCLRCADHSSAEGQPRSTHEIFEPLSSYLLNAFKSYPCLNNSFKIKKSSKRVHYSTSNLDLDDIKASFHLLTKIPTKRPLYNALFGASELLKRIQVSSYEDPRNLLWVLILFEIPFLNRALVDTDKSMVSMVEVSEIKALCYDILKRVLGILAHCHSTNSNSYMASWFSKLSKEQFSSKIDLINLYITFQLKKYFYIANNSLGLRMKSTAHAPASRSNQSVDNEYMENAILKSEEQGITELTPTNSLGLPITQQVTSPLSSRSKRKKSKNKDVKIKIHQYGNDWHIRTASIVLSTFMKANLVRTEKLPINTFYNSLVDYVNIKLDFDSWQSNRKVNNKQIDAEVPELQTVIDYIHGSQSFDSASYFFCQYPFLISLGGKISVLEYEARRQMERKAEEAFINSLDKRIAIDVYFKVRVRREYIVQDSLRCIQLNQSNLKKSLRIQFIDEPGIDAGGLKKEWFLLLTKALFNPQAGMLVNVEDSNLLWFNIAPIDNFEIYYLFGAILGLAIYNSTILDLNFPTALYKLLLGIPVNLNDYAQLYPVPSSNLFKLRNYSNDELTNLSLSFEVTYTDLFGRAFTKELIPNGSNIPITSENRELYIQKYANFFMYDGIRNQIATFTKGFSNVIGGNALSLFSPEEIQLLICGSEESKLDIDVLKSVTKYIGWKDEGEAVSSEIITWFWEYMQDLTFKQHKKFLSFVTGSDRVPATGLQNLTFRISKAGKDTNRLPVAHTCFNELAIYNYTTKEKLITKLDIAVNESAGFGIR